MKTVMVRIKKLGIFLIIIGTICITLNVMMIYAKNNGLSNFNSLQTKGKVVGLEQISQQRTKSGIYYTRRIAYNYYDSNNNLYNAIDLYGTYNKDNIVNKFEIGDEIEVSYKIDNPSISMIGRTISYILPNIQYILFYVIGCFFSLIGIYFCIQKKYEYYRFEKFTLNNSDLEFAIKMYAIFIGISLIMFSLIIGYYILTVVLILISLIILIKSQIRKSKTEELELKVVKIDSIDYEREIVFFQTNGGLYFYCTDLGEEFEEGKIYCISLKLNNLKRQNVNFNKERVKAIEICNVSKREFKKIDEKI